MKRFAAAKINLFLHVGARRADGYHDLESLAVFARVGDELAFEHADDLSLEIDGPFAAELSREGDNLVLRAARALAAFHPPLEAGSKADLHVSAKTASGRGSDAGTNPLPETLRVSTLPQGEGGRCAKVRLTKNLPVASGIGGGSADAAAALRGLAQLWDLHIEDRALNSIALSLGADVPVCLLSEPAWMEGVGERVTPVSGLPEIFMVLVNPHVAVSTARIFGALKDRTGVGQTPKPKNIRDCASLVNYLRNTSNDLETPARAEAPVIGDALNALSQYGAMLSRMSGSGATCFGLFANKSDADKASASISKANPKWWVRGAN